jgi:hypothetical protein
LSGVPGFDQTKKNRYKLALVAKQGRSMLCPYMELSQEMCAETPVQLALLLNVRPVVF